MRDWRGMTANGLMFSFILFTSVGAAMLLPAAGFITAGVACGIFGYLLGSD
jgi:predicted acyltransferase